MYQARFSTTQPSGRWSASISHHSHAIFHWEPGFGSSSRGSMGACPGHSPGIGYVRSFNGKLRDELLRRETACTLQEAQVLVERWRQQHTAGARTGHSGTDRRGRRRTCGTGLGTFTYHCGGVRTNVEPIAENGGRSPACPPRRRLMHQLQPMWPAWCATDRAGSCSYSSRRIPARSSRMLLISACFRS